MNAPAQFVSLRRNLRFRAIPTVVTAFQHQHVAPFGDELPGDERGGEPAADDDHCALLQFDCHGLRSVS